VANLVESKKLLHTLLSYTSLTLLPLMLLLSATDSKNQHQYYIIYFEFHHSLTHTTTHHTLFHYLTNSCLDSFLSIKNSFHIHELRAFHAYYIKYHRKHYFTLNKTLKTSEVGTCIVSKASVSELKS